jgi:hypothetical protein
MRLIFSSIAVALSCMATATHSQTTKVRDYYTVDGRFTICKWGELDHCEALSEKHIKQYFMTAVDIATVEKLEHFAFTKSFSGKDLINAFGQPEVARDPSDTMHLMWFDKKDRANGPISGFSMYKNKIAVASYKVRDKFSIVWYNPDDIGLGKSNANE